MYDTLVSTLKSLDNRSKNTPAFLVKKNKQWEPIHWDQFLYDIQLAASLILKNGLNAGDRVGLLSGSRYEWVVLDFACQSIGMVSVPIYQSSRFDEVEYILNHSECKLLFVENFKQWKKVEKTKDNLATVKSVFSFDKITKHPEIYYADAAKESGPLKKEDLFSHIDQRQISDNATIIYTSGTTGSPKGVLLKHQQLSYEVKVTYEEMEVGPGDISLCFLPFAHVLGRLESWGHVKMAFTMAFAESIEKVGDNLKEVNPTILMSVPRIYEKLYGKLEQLLGSNPITKSIFEWGRQTAILNAKVIQKEHSPTVSEKISLAIFKNTFASLIRKILGGKLRFAISGGAPLGKKLGEFFLGCEITLLEGYGLTETTGALFFNRPGKTRMGTVGPAVTDADIKIAQDGEILVKADNVLSEYYKDPDSTEQSFIDGYFATGDIGKVDDDGFLTITDRKKDLIKTAGGKYVAPQKLENLVKLHPMISNVLIHGDKKKYVVALITLDGTIKNTDPTAIQKAVQSHIKTVNRELSSWETIKKFKILSKDFTIDAGELTPSLKVKRKFCDNKYSDEIESLY